MLFNNPHGASIAPMQTMTLKQWISEKTPEHAAELLGVSVSSLHKYSSGRRMPRPEVCRRIVDVSGERVTYAAILDGYRGDPWRRPTCPNSYRRSRS